MEWLITSKPWAIWPTAKSKSNTKYLFRNNIQLLNPVKATSTIPHDIKCTIVDGMRVVRLISIDGSRTFADWAKKVCEYLYNLPGEILHVVFDVYSEDYDCLRPPKGRPVIGKRRFVSELSQLLPKSSEWA